MPSRPEARLVILASGGGSNADKICAYFQSHSSIHVALVITNRNKAGVREVAAKHGIECAYVPKELWQHPEIILPAFEDAAITHIILAGFLLLIPEWLIQAYPGRIINIHPALLPKYGGHGMYGHHVHEAVKASGELVSGITIHEVNAQYDEGRILFQKEVALDPDDTPEDIAAKVLRVEHASYPRVIEAWINGEEHAVH